MADFSFLEFSSENDEHEDISGVLEDYLKHIANKRLRLYKGPEYVHTEGDKQGQSLYSHIMDIISLADRLCPIVGLSDVEIRCLFLALTVHDINKIPLYGKRSDGRNVKYADAATLENI